MDTKHAKSPCCQSQIYRFGHRRRQCSGCKKTWSIRRKKRGRPRLRMQSDVLSQVFLEKYAVNHLAKRRSGIPLATFRYRFRQVLSRFVGRQNLPKLPSGPLTLLADGIWFHFRKRRWILHLMALKSCKGKAAVFLDPVLRFGNEGKTGWQQVFATIPPGPRARIRALVVDNLNGMKKIAKHEGWALQLCHFHLIQKFQIQYRRRTRRLKGGAVREEIYRLIRQVLETANESILDASLARLIRFTRTSCGTRRIQAAVQDFLISVKYYRTYLTHPELNLPHTTNTVESMASIIRDLLRRNRSASSPQSLLRWATALIRLRKKLNCNSKNHQQI